MAGIDWSLVGSNSCKAASEVSIFKQAFNLSGCIKLCPGSALIAAPVDTLQGSSKKYCWNVLIHAILSGKI